MGLEARILAAPGKGQDVRPKLAGSLRVRNVNVCVCVSVCTRARACVRTRTRACVFVYVCSPDSKGSFFVPDFSSGGVRLTMST